LLLSLEPEHLRKEPTDHRHEETQEMG